jgi:hypothetical protein
MKIKNKNILSSIVIVCAVFGFVAYASAELQPVEGDHRFEGIVNWFPHGIYVGQQGSGGVTYFNGTIINDTSTELGDNPVTFGDEVRIDGRVFRGSKQGPENISGDALPFIIDDDFLLYGDLSFADGVEIDFDGASISNFPATYTQAEIDALLAEKAVAANVYLKTDVYTKDEIHAAYDGKADQSSVYTQAEIASLLALKANSTDVYAKTEIDDNMYTQSEVDTFLSAKADVVNVYTQSQINTFLASKANSADVYTKTEIDTNTYTQSEVNALLAGKSDSGHTHDSSYVSQTNPSWNAVTTYYSVSPADLNSTDLSFITLSDIEYTISGGLSSSTAYAPITLPQGAVVTNFNVSYIDDSSSDVAFTLRRNSRDDTASLEMANITTSAENDATVRSDEDTTILSATIDNSLYTYAIRVEMPAFTSGSSSFLGAFIEYTIDGFN